MLTVLIGPPGCGKSTWARRAAAEHLSTDAVRAALVGDVDDHDRDRAVAAAFDLQVTTALREGTDVVAENGDNARRLDYLAVAREVGAGARAVVFENWDEARRQALDRPEPRLTAAEWDELAERSRAAARAVGDEDWDAVERVA